MGPLKKAWCGWLVKRLDVAKSWWENADTIITFTLRLRFIFEDLLAFEMIKQKSTLQVLPFLFQFNIEKIKNDPQKRI